MKIYVRKIIEIREEFIRLDDLLKFSGAVLTGGEAKEVIQNGEVSVNGEPCLQRGRKIYPGMSVKFDNKIFGVKQIDR